MILTLDEDQMMKKAIYCGFVAMTLAVSTPIFASGRYGHKNYVDHAKVLKVRPLTRSVRVETPHRQCWQEMEHRTISTGPRTYTPEIFGSILGAAVGNQFGSGRGKGIATAAGALLGGSIAHDIKLKNHGRTYTESRPVERCRVVNDYRIEERVVGYRVKYKYHGRIYHTRTNYDPGDRMRVNVSVMPIYP